MVLVRWGLVPDSQLSGGSCTLYLADDTVRELAEAQVHVETSYATGVVIAYCMDKLLYELIIGNCPVERG